MLLLAAVLEELHRTLMLFGCRASLEGAEVSPPPAHCRDAPSLR